MTCYSPRPGNAQGKTTDLMKGVRDYMKISPEHGDASNDEVQIGSCSHAAKFLARVQTSQFAVRPQKGKRKYENSRGRSEERARNLAAYSSQSPFSRQQFTIPPSSKQSASLSFILERLRICSFKVIFPRSKKMASMHLPQSAQIPRKHIPQWSPYVTSYQRRIIWISIILSRPGVGNRNHSCGKLWSFSGPIKEVIHFEYAAVLSVRGSEWHAPHERCGEISSDIFCYPSTLLFCHPRRRPKDSYHRCVRYSSLSIPALGSLSGIR